MGETRFSAPKIGTTTSIKPSNSRHLGEDKSTKNLGFHGQEHINQETTEPTIQETAALGATRGEGSGPRPRGVMGHGGSRTWSRGAGGSRTWSWGAAVAAAFWCAADGDMGPVAATPWGVLAVATGEEEDGVAPVESPVGLQLGGGESGRRRQGGGSGGTTGGGVRLRPVYTTSTVWRRWSTTVAPGWMARAPVVLRR